MSTSRFVSCWRSGSGIRPGLGLEVVEAHPVVELRVDRDRDPDLLAEGVRQRVLEPGPEPALELLAGEVVGHRDDRGVLVQGDRLTGAEPGALVGLEVVDQGAPHLGQVAGAGGAPGGSVAVLHAGSPDPSFVRRKACCLPVRAPQLCPQVVNVGPPCGELAPEGTTATGFCNVSAGQTACSGNVTWDTSSRGGPVPGWWGTSEGANVTSGSARDQPVIHRLRVGRFDPVRSQRVPLRGRTRCRPVPHVHEVPEPGSCVGGRCQPKSCPPPRAPDVGIPEMTI